MPEIDLDAFEFGPVIDDDQPVLVTPTSIDPQMASEIRREVAGIPAPMQMTMEGDEVPHDTKNVTPVRGFLRGLIYASRSGGESHIIVLHDTPDGTAVLCNCKAARNLARRPAGCWATVDARDIAGLHQPEDE